MILVFLNHIGYFLKGTLRAVRQASIYHFVTPFDRAVTQFACGAIYYKLSLARNLNAKLRGCRHRAVQSIDGVQLRAAAHMIWLIHFHDPLLRSSQWCLSSLPG